MIGVDESAALVLRHELVDGQGHMHGRIVDHVLACDDPAQTERRLRAVDRYSGSPLLRPRPCRQVPRWTSSPHGDVAVILATLAGWRPALSSVVTSETTLNVEEMERRRRRC